MVKDKNPVVWALKKLVSAQTSHPWLILLVALILSGISILYTLNNLTIQTSQKDLISPKEHLIQLAWQVREFEELDSFIVVIEGPEPGRSLQFLQKLTPLIEADKKNFRQVFYRIDPDALKSWALLYLDKNDIQNLVTNLEDNRAFLEETAKSPSLVNFFSQVNHELSSKIVSELFTGFLSETPDRRQPFDLEFLIRVLNGLKRFLDGSYHFVSPWDTLLSGKVGWDITQEGYFWTKDKKYLLVFVTPVRGNDLAGTSQRLSALRQYVAQTRQEFPEINAGVTGPEALNADQMGTAFQDMELATLLSLFGLTVLFIIFRKSIRRPVFEMVTLIMALSWCFGLTTLLIGHLNILSITFAPLILGLGIDYGAHWFARYQEEEESGLHSTKSELLRETMENIGPGILVAGLSLAVSFLPLTMTGFKGLAELGVICCTGMVVTNIASLTVLPALVMIFDSPRFGRRATGQSPINPMYRMKPKWTIVILAVGTAALIISVWQTSNVRFDLNMLHLQSPDVESVVWEEKLLKGSELSSIFGQILEPSLEEVRAKTKALKSLPTVSRVESVEDLLPHEQEAKLKMLKRVRPILDGIAFSPTAAQTVDVKALKEVLGRIRFKMLDTEGVGEKLKNQMVEVRTIIDEIREKVDSSEREEVQKALVLFEKSLIHDLDDKLQMVRSNVNARPMTVNDLPHSLLERLVSSNGHFLIRVYPKGDVWDPQFLGRFVQDLRSVAPNAVGDPVTLYVFTREFQISVIKAALLSGAFMFVFLLFVMREFKSAFLSIAPLLVGSVWTFGLMPPLGINLNLANSIFLPLIVGAGVEYGIIIIYRWRQKEEGKAPSTVLPSSTAWGVVLAGLTTTFGFGSLMISSHRGIFSLGLLTTVGSLAVLVASVVFLPAVLEVLQLRKDVFMKGGPDLQENRD
ncbi:MAG TPA: MMPL family transporter [Syntrophales bacterium]|nr:MMPL family transporter [Syntrophales bacterium]